MAGTAGSSILWLRIRSVKEKVAMIHFDRHWLRPLVRLALVMLCTVLLAGAAQLCQADEPKPDPAGIATGDKTTAVDAGGTGFVVSQPTGDDAKNPAKVKAYNDFKALADKEPLAMKLADD